MAYGARLEHTLSKAILKGHVASEAKEAVLCNKLWTGLRNKDLKRTTHHLYSCITEFQTLLREVRTVEQQELNTDTLPSKPKATHQQAQETSGNAHLLKQMG